MSVAIKSAPASRTVRLTVLVSAAEAAEVARHAAVAGQSVSAWLRDRALGARGNADEEAILHQVDAVIERMEADLSGAIAAVSGCLDRLGAR